MKIVELILDEEQDNFVEAISVVENPAIEEDFVALKTHEIKFEKADEDKKILIGPVLIPNKPIFRKSGADEYYIYFSRQTVQRASQLYLKQGNQSAATLEHADKIKGLTLVESWIVEDKKNDKSNAYGMDVPLGTWMGAIKVDNDEVWNDYVKTGKVKGFSIEGYFADKADIKENEEEDLAAEILSELKNALAGVELETYNDYPKAAVENAKRAIKYKEEKGTSCGTTIGWTRAGQLSRNENLSRSTIARMASFKRHQQNKDVPYDEGCGGIMWDAWGGTEGVEWAIKKLEQIDKNNLADDVIVVNEDYAIIMGHLAYSNKEVAEMTAADYGCEGTHVHEYEGQQWFMPCKEHFLNAGKNTKSPCWDGYQQKGWKKGIGGKRVPNCEKIK